MVEMFTFIGFRLDLGSSQVDLQQIQVVVGAVECGCGYIAIITSLAIYIHIRVCVVLLFRTV